MANLSEEVSKCIKYKIKIAVRREFEKKYS